MTERKQTLIEKAFWQSWLVRIVTWYCRRHPWWWNLGMAVVLIWGMIMLKANAYLLNDIAVCTAVVSRGDPSYGGSILAAPDPHDGEPPMEDRTTWRNMYTQLRVLEPYFAVEDALRDDYDHNRPFTSHALIEVSVVNERGNLIPVFPPLLGYVRWEHLWQRYDFNPARLNATDGYRRSWQWWPPGSESEPTD